ncbi:MAG: ParB/RepB/Spo0J family partition protein [Rudaea sp.]|uniref:ParB/RepB/Spo0J family partition protein n=1 Tax=unclassified Rudaea TaxID=2627037 RepID=UPI0010F5F267|nr:MULTISPECIES: ParB/RepB/Spo0J family partition protein [unclassified Rudaea]MBN8888443.1 ParB/RepB/Spo0J family partition protein [Rudaea sp.]MBR0347522.1 ParB/RepB/Spo0J family partition protein [Rudaea sp.]
MSVTNVRSLPLRTAADLRVSALDRLSAVDRQELVLELPLDRIDRDPDQPRKKFDGETLIELAQNLTRFGQIQPVEVREVGERYVLIDGERRWRAAAIAKLTTLRALVKFEPGTPDDVLDRQFAVNYHRDAMALIDQARYLQSRIDRLGSAAAASEAIGLSVPRILNITKTLRAEGAAAELRDSGLTRDADTIGAMVEVQKHNPTAAETLLARAKENGKLTRKEAQDAARLAKERARRVDEEEIEPHDDRAAIVRDFAGGRGMERKPKPAQPQLVVLLACEGNELQRAQWNKLSRQHGRACLSLVATTTHPGCVLVEFGAHSEPFPADVLRILDARFEQEKSR